MVEGRHIQRVSGHKCLESVQLYGRRLSTSRKRDTSRIFSRAVGNGPIPIQPRPTPTNLSASDSQGSSSSVPVSRDRGFQVEAPTPSETYPEVMAIQQSRIERQLNLPNFAPNFSLLPNFQTTTTTSNDFTQQELIISYHLRDLWALYRYLFSLIWTD